MSLKLTVADTAHGGTGKLPGGFAVFNFFRLQLTGILEGPKLNQIEKGGSFFQMTAAVIADVYFNDPRINVIHQWSMDPATQPVAIQEVKVDHKSGKMTWSNNRIYDYTDDAPNLLAKEIGRLEVASRFQSKTGRVSSLWGKFTCPDIVIDLPAVGAVSAQKLSVDAFSIVVNIPTHTLEWRFKPGSTPKS